MTKNLKLDNGYIIFMRMRISIGYHIRGRVIIVLLLERRYQAKYDIVSRAIKLILPSLECDNIFITYLCLYQSYSGAKIRFYFLTINHLISFPNERKSIVKNTLNSKNKPRITYLFPGADIFLLLACYHNIFCFFTTDLLSDAIFVFAAGQKPYRGYIIFMSPCLSP